MESLKNLTLNDLASQPLFILVLYRTIGDLKMSMPDWGGKTDKIIGE